MAQRQYDIVGPVGSRFKEAVVEASGSSIGTSSVRVIVDDVNAGTKANVIQALQAIMAYIIEQPFPDT